LRKKESSLLERWKIHGRKTEHTNPIFQLISLKTTSPRNHLDYTFYRIECGDWVNILPVTSDHQVVLVKQYRAGIENFSIEIPGGLIDEGEDPSHAALRELREETGYSTVPEKLIDLGFVHPNPAIMNNKCFLFAAEDVKMSGTQQLDMMEDIEILLMPLREFIEQIRNNEITHALVLDTVLRYSLAKGWFLL
jgi:8-oxo-dGTP pyrophosphatase MutT (NUDIX family)